MKRTNVVLDDVLLEEAVRLSGERTYARTIERALAEMVRRLRATGVFRLADRDVWSGDLAAMRGDSGGSGEAGPDTRRPRGVYRTGRGKSRVSG